MRQERDAMQTQRQQHMTSMRDLLQRNGLPVPQWRHIQGKPGMGKPGGPGYGGGSGTPQPL